MKDLQYALLNKNKCYVNVREKIYVKVSIVTDLWWSPLPRCLVPCSSMPPAPVFFFFFEDLWTCWFILSGKFLRFPPSQFSTIKVICVWVPQVHLPESKGSRRLTTWYVHVHPFWKMCFIYTDTHSCRLRGHQCNLWGKKYQ